MRTAIVSDLHLGLTSGGDVLRDAGIRRTLFEEIADADRVVLLGDVVELREMPVGPALERARPCFEELGEALGEGEVTIVPGNHDHHLAGPLLDELSLNGGAQLGFEQTHDPSPGPTAAIDAWLGPAKLRIAYPGLWLREDVYVTHGHYMDAHLPVPRAECLAIATVIRLSKPVPATATVADYERVVRPLYGFAYGVAQSRRVPGRTRKNPSEAAWRVLTANDGVVGRGQRLRSSAIRNGFPAGIWALNRLLHSNFEPDISSASIFGGGLAAATEMARRLGLDGVHVINGHTHRAGPTDDEAAWPLAGGGHLHNTGSWVFSPAFQIPDDPYNPYWPGTLTWVEESGAPRRVQLLRDRSHEEMAALFGGFGGG
jgi:UDP-2,3-diacylglucosamine pyrophosphatase LpxH